MFQLQRAQLLSGFTPISNVVLGQSSGNQCRNSIPATKRTLAKKQTCSFNANNLVHTRCTIKSPRASIISASAPSSTPASASAPLSIATQSFHSLPNGMRLELLSLPAASTTSSEAASSPQKPPLLFIHGSYHGAWCWAERFLPYFAAAGYDTIAVSLRGQGGSDRGTLKVSGDLQSHADDLASVVASLPRPPVIVGHSFGGLLVEQYCSQLGQSGRPDISGVALLCAVPPSGNKDIVVRITKRSLMDSLKITWAFVGKSFARSIDACRDTFFSPDIPPKDLEIYQAQLAACSPLRLLDLGALNKVLPLPPLPPAAAKLQAFVGGGVNDLVVDSPAVEETARYFGVKAVMWDSMAHDCMLDTRWETAAGSLRKWLDEL